MEDSTQGHVVEQLVAGVQAELRGLVETLVQQQEADLRALEGQLRQQGQALLTGLLGRVLATSPAAVSRAVRPCPTCQQPLVDLGLRPKTLHLTLGDVAVRRVCGSCPRCRHTHAALDAQLGIDQSGRSPQLVAALALLGAERPFAPAAERLGRRWGVAVSPSQLEQVTEGVGRTLAAAQEAAVAHAWATGELPPVEQTRSWLVVALAGVLVAERDG